MTCAEHRLEAYSDPQIVLRTILIFVAALTTVASLQHP